ncbi:MAG: hypothetical protein CMO26_16055 [Thiotrichales bacterium]|nr:hypothetical protein [Thiotrichales bacterium]|tara:strand:+ start:1965 stop:2582 length:618 start_codon:yes stop_codon:yes gene_type:complete
MVTEVLDMHARINYVDIKPASMGEVDEFWRTVVKGYEGLARGFFLRDADTPHTLSVVVFNTEKQMVDNTEQQLGAVVKQASSHRLTEPELHHMEIGAYVDFDAEGAGCARVLELTLKPERMHEVADDWAEQVAKYRDNSALRGGYMCCNRDTGKVRSITFWGSKDDVLANESGGAMNAAVGPYEDIIAVPPVKSYWDVRVEVLGG